MNHRDFNEPVMMMDHGWIVCRRPFGAQGRFWHVVARAAKALYFAKMNNRAVRPLGLLRRGLVQLNGVGGKKQTT